MITAKYNRKISCYDLSKFVIGKKCSLYSVSESFSEVLAKAHCLMMVHTGVNKNTANEAIYINYESSMKGMETYYLMNKDNNKNLDPPLRVSLDEHDDHIYKCIDSIIQMKRSDPRSSYHKAHNSLFWGFSHDAINKFGKDLLGVFIQGVDQDTVEPIVCVERLKQIPGGHTGELVADHLVKVMCEVMSVQNSAFDEIGRYLEGSEGYDDRIKPLDFFKLGKIIQVNREEMEIHIKLDNTPIANTGDGVASNGKASRLLYLCYGFATPSYHCATHSADLVVKRMAKSKTMSVPEVASAYNALKPVVKHFQFSSKSKERLDKAMKILDLTPMNLISWGGTRMCHFMTACHRFGDVLPAVHDAMFSLKAREEDRNTLFTHVNLYVISLMADLKPCFKDSFLRKNDKEIVLVSTVHRMAAEFTDKLQTIPTPTADAFVAGLKLDSNNNLQANIEIKGNTHTITLNRQSRKKRGQDQVKELEDIKSKLEEVMSDVLQNAIENVKSLTGKEETCYFMWSGFDLQSKFSIDQRLSNLRPLLCLFTEGKIHQVLSYADCKTALTWQGFTIHLHHPRRITGSREEFEKEFCDGWPILSKMWLSHCINTVEAERDQLVVIRKFVDEYVSVYPTMCCFIYIMLATPANTSNVERAYSILEIICQPRRNRLSVEHLELLFLLSVMREEVGNVADYVECLKYLEKDK